MGTLQDDHERVISPLELSRCYFCLVNRCIKVIRVCVCVCVLQIKNPTLAVLPQRKA